MTNPRSPDILLFDANAIGYAAMYQPALAQMKFKGRSTAALHGLPVSIFRLRRLYPNATPIILWDGRCQWRYDLYPDYKSDRWVEPEKAAIRAEYRFQTPFLRQLFFAMGLPQVGHPDTEADDVAGLIARNMPKDLHIQLVTTDSDWVQAMDHNVSWFNPRVDVLTTVEDLRSPDFKDGPFDSPEQYIQAKCMAGDESDSIAGVKGIGLKTAAKALREYGSFESLWGRADAGEAFRGAKLLSMLTPEARETYSINRSIMDWTYAPIPPDLAINMPAPDRDRAADIAQDWGLKKLAEQIKSHVVDQDYWRDHILAVERAMHYREHDESVLGLSRFPSHRAHVPG